jgi:hypothetical protein
MSTAEVIWNFESTSSVVSLEEHAGFLYAGLGENSYSKFNIENGSLSNSMKGFFSLALIVRVLCWCFKSNSF